MRSISVVIPTYNGRSLLESYLPPLFLALEEGKMSYEVIVVDDASTDDTEAFIHAHYPAIRYLRQTQNCGFAATINRGIFAATGDVVCCLNNDMEVAPTFFSTLLPYFDREDTFGVMSPIYDITRTTLLESTKYPVWGFPTIKIKDKECQQGAPSLFVCGGNALYHRERLQSLGGFSLLYEPCYFEDVDLSVRAWSVGWKSYCDPATACYHMHSATMKNVYKQQEITRISYRNRLFFNYLFTKKEKRKAFIQGVKYSRIRYRLMGWNAKRRSKICAIDEFLTNIQRVEESSRCFDNFCHHHHLQRASLREIISTYFD